MIIFASKSCAFSVTLHWMDAYLMIDGSDILGEIALRWMSLDLTGGNSDWFR